MSCFLDGELSKRRRRNCSLFIVGGVVVKVSFSEKSS